MAEQKTKSVERNTSHIGFRVWELAAIQKEKGLNFQILTGSALDGAEGMVMVISNRDIKVERVDLESTPYQHRELLQEKNPAQVLLKPNCVHLKSSGNVKKELGVSFEFSKRQLDDRCNVTMIRREGGSILNQSFVLERNEVFFIIANEVSLTAKQGELGELVMAGVKIDDNWDKIPVSSMLQ